jgi:outer membrane receptor protein involved in Fe transport
MKIDARFVLLLALGIAFVFPTGAWAQGRGNANGHGKNKHENRRVVVIDRDDDGDDDRIRVRERDRDRVRERDWDRIRVERRDRDRDRFVLRSGGRTIILHDDDFLWYPVRSDRGPSFCRSGAGHPVFGIQWCLQKGYGIGRPGAVFLWGDDVFLRDRTRVIVLRDRRYDADQAFWSAVVGQVLALVD